MGLATAADLGQIRETLIDRALHLAERFDLSLRLQRLGARLFGGQTFLKRRDPAISQRDLGAGSIGGQQRGLEAFARGRRQLGNITKAGELVGDRLAPGDGR